MPNDWSGIGKVKVYGNQGKYLPPDGEFKLQILKTFTKKTRNKGDAFIVDYKILESDHDDVKEDQVYNWFQSLSDEDIAFPAIKGFMVNLLAIDEEDKEQVKEFEDSLEDLMEDVSDEKWEKMPADKLKKHPLHGLTIAVRTSNKVTKKSGKDFTVHDWSPWSPED